MYKIAPGGSGQAFLFETTTVGPFVPPPSPLVPDWRIHGASGLVNVTMSESDGWTATEGGMVGVPIDAPLGAYQLSYLYSIVTFEELPGVYASNYKLYQFEVVCMTATITGEQI